MFTQRHYIAVAKIFIQGYKRQVNKQYDSVTLMNMETLFCDMFQQDNKKFNKAKFEKYITDSIK